MEFVVVFRLAFSEFNSLKYLKVNCLVSGEAYTYVTSENASEAVCSTSIHKYTLFTTNLGNMIRINIYFYLSTGKSLRHFKGN